MSPHGMHGLHTYGWLTSPYMLPYTFTILLRLCREQLSAWTWGGWVGIAIVVGRPMSAR